MKKLQMNVQPILDETTTMIGDAINNKQTNSKGDQYWHTSKDDY